MLQSHTATQQWQSFEIRMRRRRVERCLLRASVALEAGVLEDVRTALEEVERLAPHEPTLHTLTAQLALAEARLAHGTRETPAVVPPAVVAPPIVPPVVASPVVPPAVVAPAVVTPPAVPARAPAAVPVTLAEARVSHSTPETPAVAAPAVVAPAVAAPAVVAPAVVTPPAVPARASAAVPVTLAETPLVHETLFPGLSIEPEVARPRGGRAAAYAIAALVIALSGAGGWFYVTGLPPAVQPMARSDRPAQPQADAATAGVAPATAPAVHVSETAVAAARTTLEPATAEPAVATAGPDRAADSSAVTTAPPPPPPPTTIDAGKPTPPRTTEPPASPTSAANTTAPTPPPVVDRPRTLEPSPSLPEPPPVAPVAVAGGVALTDTSVNLTPPPVVPPPPAAAAPAPPPAPAAAAPQNDERLVRAVLSRYEAAYSALDAGAASRVWPTVDRRALASAFDGLQSQTVSLGRCEVRTSGATAQAECTGTARWNPKVGGGPQSASRQWHFELRNTGGDWIIARATVR